MTRGLPVGISNFEISLSLRLKRYLQRALIEFPCAEIKIFLFSIFFFNSSLKNLITLSYVSFKDSVSGILSIGISL